MTASIDKFHPKMPTLTLSLSLREREFSSTFVSPGS